MRVIQKILQTILPSATVQRMRTETNRWQIRCTTCGQGKPLWDAGGVRYGKTAVGNATATIIRCSRCGGFHLGIVERATTDSAATPQPPVSNSAA